MKTYLTVPYHQKDAAKRLGAKWDCERRMWYVTDVDDISAYLQWMPDHLKKPVAPGRVIQPEIGKCLGDLRREAVNGKKGKVRLAIGRRI